MRNTNGLAVWVGLLTFGVLVLLGTVRAAQAETKRPNIIFVLADDLRADSVGFHPGSRAQTPNLNQLASKGTVFRNAFVTTSICCVSRASILSGQWVRRHGIQEFSTPLSDEALQQTYPVLLRKAGYKTGFIGKWGVGSDQYVAAAAKQFDVWNGLDGQGGNEFIDAKGQHQTALFGDQAVAFLNGAKADVPFCLSISFTAPHARDRHPINEFTPDPRDEKLHENEELPRSPLETEEAFQAIPPFVQTSEGRPRYERRFATPEMTLRTKRNYLRLIAGIDREMGRMMEALKAQGLADNTIIIFTGDNGFALGDRGMSDKWYMWEEDIRVPLLVMDPRVPADKAQQKIDAIALNVDIAPTILAQAGIAAPSTMQGSDLAPWTQGHSVKTWRTDFLYEHHTLDTILAPSEGIRTTNRKYIRWMYPADQKKGVEARAEALYDLAADPWEQHNLAADPAHASELETLRKRWEEQTQQLR